jgi:hypothetical protein
MVIDSFPSSEEAKRYQASELVDFVQGKIPYSHLGYWRDLVDSDLNGVHTINTSLTYATAKHRHERRPGPFQKAERPSVFVAVPMQEILANNQRDIVGIAPYGSQIGDVVLSFVDSRIALIMRATTLENSAISQQRHEVDYLRYRLIGRASVFSSHMQTTLHVRSQLAADKNVETIKTVKSVMSTSFDLNPAELFPITLSIDLSTLQIITKSKSNHLASGFTKPTLELLPSRNSHSGAEDTYAHRLQKAADDSELEKMQQNPVLKRHALGPGYTAISNPGSIGYLICALQILYMVKPFRMVFKIRQSFMRSTNHM